MRECDLVLVCSGLFFFFFYPSVSRSIGSKMHTTLKMVNRENIVFSLRPLEEVRTSTSSSNFTIQICNPFLLYFLYPFLLTVQVVVSG